MNVWMIAACAIAGAAIGATIALYRGQTAQVVPDDVPPVVVGDGGRARVLLMGDSNASGLWAPFRSSAGVDAKAVGRAEKFDKDTYMSLPDDTSILGGMGAWYFSPRRIRALVEIYHPDVIVVSLGGNDFQWAEPMKTKMLTAVKDIVSVGQSAGAHVVWLEPQAFPFADRTGALQAWRTSGAEVLPQSEPALPISGDKVHLTRAGYEEWSRRIWAWLRARGFVGVRMAA